MYAVDENDRVIILDAAPLCDGGAPLPAVVSDDHKLMLAYFVAEADPSWDGKTAKSVAHDTSGKVVAIVRFQQPYCHMLGPPNDEAFIGHPLAKRGLKRYAVAEVVSSSWIRGLEAMNAVHPFHKPELFADYRHFIFTFHDSTFECVAGDFTVEVMRGSMRGAVEQMAKEITGVD